MARTETQDVVAPKLHFSPANALLREAEALCAEIHPRTFSFPRWYATGEALWLESSSGSHLLTINFASGKVVLPTWKVERDGIEATRPLPERLMDLHRGSMFLPDGSAADPDAFEAARQASPYAAERS